MLAAVVAVAAACVPVTPPPPPPQDLVEAACTGGVAAAAPAPVVSNELVEASGLAASRAHPSVLWAHNDSGDTARVFAIGFDGADLGTWTVPSLTALDWEDMAIGPDPASGGDALYVGDIGDNAQSRASVTVVRFAEPDPGAGSGSTAAPEVLTLTYPDGPHDAEALLVDPVDATVVVVTKETSGPAHMFVTPAGTVFGGSATLESAGNVPLALVTAGDAAPDGAAVMLRTYGGVRMYRRAAGQSIADALGTAGCDAAAAAENQGEAAAFLAGSDGYVTVSEGSHQDLHRFTR
jgi:hypothetical protein